MIHILFFVLCLVNCHDNHAVHGIQHTLQEDLELERQLQLINKTPVKSVHVFYILIFLLLYTLFLLDLILVCFLIIFFFKYDVFFYLLDKIWIYC